jgi:thiamine biosynthesis lipoprotein
MKQTKLIMGMPITMEIIEPASEVVFTDVFNYFRAVDRRYSTYKANSEISRINRGLPRSKWSPEMRAVMRLCDQTKQATKGYFDINHQGKLDPSGLVKGWAIQNAAQLLLKRGEQNFYIDGGGDIQVHGHNDEDEPWRVGLRNPFNRDEIIKSLSVTSEGVATSGTYIRGQHIYDPFHETSKLETVMSLTVVGPNIYEADRFATAAFAMGLEGIAFIESKIGLEGYMVDRDRVATFTTGFERYVA